MRPSNICSTDQNLNQAKTLEEGREVTLSEKISKELGESFNSRQNATAN